MISKETAARIWKAYREIDSAENLLKEMEEIRKKTSVNEHAPTIRDAFGRRKQLQMGIPSGENCHQLFEVSPVLAKSVIVAHIANKKAELAEANEVARVELIQGA